MNERVERTELRHFHTSIPFRTGTGGQVCRYWYQRAQSDGSASNRPPTGGQQDSDLFVLLWFFCVGTEPRLWFGAGPAGAEPPVLLFWDQ